MSRIAISVDVRAPVSASKEPPAAASMPQGISVFDEGLRLRVWNQGFIDVLGLPNTAVYEGVPFSDLIRIPATRGEYGPGDVESHVQRITGIDRAAPGVLLIAPRRERPLAQRDLP